jgi:hypothetical protein
MRPRGAQGSDNVRITTAILALGIALGTSNCAGCGGFLATNPSYASCVDLRNMGAALSPMCQYLLEQGPYDQDLSSQGGYTGGGSPGTGSSQPSGE